MKKYMPRRRACAALLAATVAGLGSWHAAHAQSYPNKPVQLVVPFPPGGAVDIVGRLISKKLGDQLGQPIVIENKGGAGTIVGASYVANATADGYTLLISSGSTFTVNPALHAKLPYDPVKSYEPIGMVARVPLILLANRDVPVNNLKQLISAVQAQPGKYVYGSFGSGTTGHFAAELAWSAIGVKLLHVPYKGSADLMQAILGGQLMAATDSTGFAPQVEAGKLRVLNTWGSERLAKFPDAPTLKELGLNIVQNSPFGIGAPKGTPADVVKRLHDAFKQAMEQESYRTALGRYDMVPIYMGTSEYQKFAQDTFAREKALVEKLGLVKAP